MGDDLAAGIELVSTQFACGVRKFSLLNGCSCSFDHEVALKRLRLPAHTPASRAASIVQEGQLCRRPFLPKPLVRWISPTPAMVSGPTVLALGTTLGLSLN